MSNEKKSLEQAADLLHALVEGFFGEGDIPGESAYAWAVLASSYVDHLLGDDENYGLIELYESKPMSVPLMFATDMAIDKQIEQLEAQREILKKASPPRHQLIMAHWDRMNDS